MIHHLQSSRCAKLASRAWHTLAPSLFLVNTLIGVAEPHWISGTVVPSGLVQSLLMAAIRWVVMAVIALRRPR